LGDAQAYTVYLNPIYCAGVEPLSFGRRPFAIRWFVISIVVNAIQAIFSEWRRTRPHVGKKILKRMKPSGANFNSSAAINWIFGIAGIKASLFHAAPRAIFWGLRFMVRSSVCIAAQQTRRCLAGQTSTTSGYACANVRGCGDDSSSTIAAAFPHNIFGFGDFYALDRHQPPKPYTRQLFSFSHIENNKLILGIIQGGRSCPIR
jgi:hypothetical protein